MRRTNAGSATRQPPYSASLVCREGNASMTTNPAHRPIATGAIPGNPFVLNCRSGTDPCQS
jgi:hypothetical protein